MAAYKASTLSNPQPIRLLLRPCLPQEIHQAGMRLPHLAETKSALPPIVFVKFDSEEELKSTRAKCLAYIDGEVYDKCGKIVEPGKVMTKMHWRIIHAKEEWTWRAWAVFEYALSEIWIVEKNYHEEKGFGDYETNKENEFLKKVEELREAGNNECLIKMDDMYVRGETTDVWHNAFVHLPEAKIHRLRRFDEELKEIEGVLEAELEDQIGHSARLQFLYG